MSKLNYWSLFVCFFLPLVLAFCGPAQAQTATITALTGQSCVAERAGGSRSCVSNDFATILSFDQPAATALANCRAGSVVSVDVLAEVTSGSAQRYDIGLFVGEEGQVPADAATGSTCSLGLFPTSPNPFLALDFDTCGDFQLSSTAILEVQSVNVLCTPAAGTNLLSVPYTLVFNNRADGNTCTASNITAGTNAKCIKSSAATLTGVEVNGYVTITKQTDPDGDAASFDFAASSSATVTPASASLGDGGSQTFLVPLSGTGSRTLTITEAALAGWDSTASISCTDPSGGNATYVTVSNATRTIEASLDAINYGAVCTITNSKIQNADLVTVKTLASGDATPAEGDTVTYL
ncbi:hypothetical protein RXV86_21695, partial [Alisedimentitalea sp. MJ-SS2]|uniref:prealbumin-like fold domain-containing protein n=1 Tax=Aliisedimentitalea sp. MJ-SS2 TaxID=3049795 RepID=UPI00290EA621